MNKKLKNINIHGFTDWGLVNYGALRTKGIPIEKATKRLIDEDALNLDPRSFRQRLTKKKK